LSLSALIVKDKVEVISSWDDSFRWEKGSMKHPAIVRLKYYVRIKQVRARFNRRGIFRRDMFACQYCGKVLSASKLTLDHVKPTSVGGKSTWENCTTSCLPCNAKKANKTPEQANMKLSSIPAVPQRTMVTEYILTKPKHNDWEMYFPQVQHMNPHTHIVLEEMEDDNRDS